ncbi:hydroxyethylthiazole kinase-like uncharacterized protein yjeF/hydroxyethylthiazole kinase-like uncharacterized protein yjeF [Mesorhizobium sp. J18]|uniref:NAD(P)H-hydrate dehydratase n=1 Tax=Mesorhizobium sp. J18 TaxID=935263 RepID=UPI00119AF295|nr:NAD(P)H-hydrate dehydratase [Mesorhizobium sp. J18]TWG98456.1 hydroxyethylthiazole kinase-like uncharacterized protein yjeF/hydroxyethylthiazole kinase-like uncharacterized protein yjeF [Mesorhizobium sp. J18]
MLELLTPDEMAMADRLAAERGPFDGYRLMENAGAAVVAEILTRLPDAGSFDVLCGPGNNGGDGYVVARLLREAGLDVRLWRDAAPRQGTDAAKAAASCPLEARALADFAPQSGALVIDALFGAGLSKPVGGVYAAAIEKVSHAGGRVVAIDLSSGISGASGAVLGSAFKAELTVTFFRKKPGHLLYPGRAHCGDIVVADIGIPDAVLKDIAPSSFENHPALWLEVLPRPAEDAHKYRRGHVAVFSGGASSTGAARLSALGAARAGAGAVTVLSPPDALLINAAHLTAIMLRRCGNVEALGEFIHDRKPSSFVLGPGFGLGETLQEFALAVLETTGEGATLVLDADGITSFRDAPASLFIAAGARGAPGLVLTPHEGEFGRLFPGLAEEGALSKLDKARKAAARSHGTVVYKGPDTVIAAPDGRAAINTNGTPWLATAGSGDVLAGIIAGLAAHGMPPFEAACAAVWIHAEAARSIGPGLIAEDLPAALAPVLQKLYSKQGSALHTLHE